MRIWEMSLLIWLSSLYPFFSFFFFTSHFIFFFFVFFSNGWTPKKSQGKTFSKNEEKEINLDEDKDFYFFWVSEISGYKQIYFYRYKFGSFCCAECLFGGGVVSGGGNWIVDRYRKNVLLFLYILFKTYFNLFLSLFLHFVFCRFFLLVFSVLFYFNFLIVLNNYICIIHFFYLFTFSPLYLFQLHVFFFVVFVASMVLMKKTK